MVINPAMFCGLLDNLAGRFFREWCAYCTTAEDFAGQLSKDAQEFFSIAIIGSEALVEDDIVGVLCDDTKNQGGKDTYTFVIFVNSRKFRGETERIALAVLLAHEICHFAFFYELFIEQEGAGRMVMHNNFIKAVSCIPTGYAAGEYEKYTRCFDAHNMAELIKIMGKHEKEHFTNGKDSNIDYRQYFFDFVDHFSLLKN